MEIRIDTIRFAYAAGGFRLHIPALHLPSGSRMALTGVSGAGKTTLLRLLAGILLPAAGTLTLDGVSPASLGEAGRRAFRITRIGFVFQDFELLDYLDTAENIRLPYRINPAARWTSDVALRRDALIHATGLDGVRRRPVRTLSQGERQRVTLCRALLPGPGLVLADEPTGNLDPDAKRQALDLLLAECGKAGATLVMATHDHTLLDAFDRVIDFRDFRAGGEGTA